MKTKHLLIYALAVFGLIALNSQCKKSTTPMEVESSITENSGRIVGPAIKLDSIKDSCMTFPYTLVDTFTCTFRVSCYDGNIIKTTDDFMNFEHFGNILNSDCDFRNVNSEQLDSIIALMKYYKDKYKDCKVTINHETVLPDHTFTLDSTVHGNTGGVFPQPTCYHHYSKTSIWTKKFKIKVCCPKKKVPVKGKPKLIQAPPTRL